MISFKQYLLQESSVTNYLKDIAKMQHLKKKGYAYDGPAEFVLKHGKQYQSAELTSEELEMLKHVLKRQCDYEAKKCFYNAQSIGLAGTIGYVEGYADSVGIPMDHAWNTINGKVIDMTWKMNNGGEPVLGVIPEGWEYHGVELPHQLINSMWSTGKSSTIINDWENDFPLLKEPFDDHYEINY
jgi:hypothetical protein